MFSKAGKYWGALPPIIPAPIPPWGITGAIVRAGEGVLDQGASWLSLHIAVIEPYLHPVHQNVWQRDTGDADGPVPECRRKTNSDQQTGNHAGQKGHDGGNQQRRDLRSFRLRFPEPLLSVIVFDCF